MTWIDLLRGLFAVALAVMCGVVFIGRDGVVDMAPLLAGTAALGLAFRLLDGRGGLLGRVRPLLPAGLGALVLSAFAMQVQADGILSPMAAAQVSVPFCLFMAIGGATRFEMLFLIVVSSMNVAAGVWKTEQGADFPIAFGIGIVTLSVLLLLTAIRYERFKDGERQERRARLGLPRPRLQRVVPAATAARRKPRAMPRPAVWLLLASAGSLSLAAVLGVGLLLFALLPRPVDADPTTQPDQGDEGGSAVALDDEDSGDQGDGWGRDPGGAAMEFDMSGEQASSALPSDTDGSRRDFLTGFDSELTLRGQSRLLQDPTPLYAVTYPGAAPNEDAEHPTYWRMDVIYRPSYDEFGDLKWDYPNSVRASHQRATTSRRFRLFNDPELYPARERARLRAIRPGEFPGTVQQAWVEPLVDGLSKRLPMPEHATKLEIPSPMRIAPNPEMMIAGIAGSVLPVAYGVEHSPVRADPKLIGDAASRGLGHSRYRQLPEGRPATLRAEANRIVEFGLADPESLTDYERVLRITSYFRNPDNGYQYQLRTPPVPDGRTLTEEFLLNKQARYGFCATYASTATVLLRELDIPTRMVVGFLTGVPQPRAVTPTWNLRGRDFHVWIEVFFDGWGWQRFDPTPEFDPDRAALEGAQWNQDDTSEDESAGDSDDGSDDEERNRTAAPDEADEDDPFADGESGEESAGDDDEDALDEFLSRLPRTDAEAGELAGFGPPAEAQNWLGQWSAEDRRWVLEEMERRAPQVIGVLLLLGSLGLFGWWITLVRASKCSRQQRRRRGQGEVIELAALDTQTRRAADRLLRQITQTLRRHHIPIPPHRTLQEIADTLTAAPLKDPMPRIAASYYAVRYGTVRDPAAIAALEQEIAALG